MIPNASLIKNLQSAPKTNSNKSDEKSPNNYCRKSIQSKTPSNNSELKTCGRPLATTMTLNFDMNRTTRKSIPSQPTPVMSSSQSSPLSELSSSSSKSSLSSSYSIVVAIVYGLLIFLLINISCVEASREHSSPMNLEGKVGSYVVFNCRVDFPYDYHIPYVVHWSKDNKKIFTWYDGDISTSELFSGRLSLVDNHNDYGKASANLTAIRESDQGLYHCQIIFPNRTPSYRNNGTFFQLTVEGGSLIKIPPINQTIMEGQTAFFHCAMKYPNISKVTWHKDGVPLNEQQDLERRSRMGPDGSLSIDPTMMSDLGEYECNVKNNDGEVQSAKAYLNIQYKAKVIYSPPEVYLPYGQPAVLDCHFRSNPPLKNLRWEKDGLLFDSYNVPGVFYKMNGSLFFSKVDENHSGSYTCTPYNELGTDGPSPIINVIVQRPPIFTISPKPIYIHKLGENAQLSCEASERDGNHLPTMGWTRKDGIPLPEGRYNVQGGNLTVFGIVESDRGIYECSATNGAATITVDTELMIENVAPRPPHNLTANSTETAITIRWQPGYLRPNLEYIVWYRLSDAAEWRTMRILTKNVMEATIKNLLPGREYEFMVLSQDRYGDGMFSKLFHYSTKGSNFSEPEQFHDPIPPSSKIGPPRNLTALENSHGYLLHWDPPIHGLDALRLYVIRWWREPEHYLIGSAETIDTYYQLRHLKEDATYKVQISSQSLNGDQEASNELELVVPSHRKMRAVVIGSAVGVIFLVTAFCAFLYVKRSCFQHLKSNNEKINDT